MGGETGTLWFLLIAFLYLAIFMVVSAFRSKAAPAKRRVALVIGNEAYEPPHKLTKPVKDANAIAGALKRLGFEVVNEEHLHNLDVAAMQVILKNFEGKAKRADWALVYYSGHGVERKGENWLVPIGADRLPTTTQNSKIKLFRCRTY